MQIVYYLITSRLFDLRWFDNFVRMKQTKNNFAHNVITKGEENMGRLLTLSAALLSGLAAVLSTNARADTYPSRAITLVVPWPAGGGIDIPGRLLAETAAKAWKVPVNVVNQPGASGVSGTIEGLGAAPDGYSLMIDSPATSSLQPIAVKNLPFHFRDRTYVARALTLPMNLFVKADSPYKTLDDVKAAIKKNPGGFIWGSASPSTVTAVVMSQLFAAFGVDAKDTKRVMFKGGPDVAQAVAGGHVQISSIAVAGTVPLVSAQKLRSIAVLMPERVSLLPDVATAREQGYPTIDATAWIGVSGPKGLPQDVIKKWNDLLRNIESDETLKAAAMKVGAIPFYSDGAALLAEVDREHEAAKIAAGLK